MRSLPALLAAKHRGRVWEPWEGSPGRLSVAPRRTAELLPSGGSMSLGDGFRDSKGGYSTPATILGDTWEWDGTAGQWIRQWPATSPSARFFHAMTYDSCFGPEAGNGTASQSRRREYSGHKSPTKDASSAMPSPHLGSQGLPGTLLKVCIWLSHQHDACQRTRRGSALVFSQRFGRSRILPDQIRRIRAAGRPAYHFEVAPLHCDKQPVEPREKRRRYVRVSPKLSAAGIHSHAIKPTPAFVA